jgi:formylglycine-generating enzyme required for sulfatase activity
MNSKLLFIYKGFTMRHHSSLSYSVYLFLSIIFITNYVYSQDSIMNQENANFTVSGIQMIALHGGTFTMGSSESDARSNETPHAVTVGRFAIMKYEVTVAEFKRFIDATGYQTDADKGTGGFGSLLRHGNTKIRTYTKGVNWKCGASGELRPQSEYNHPVIHVSWNDAVAYAQWLTQKTGQTWRLPTEAEWEYAAKSGQNYKYAGSNNIHDVGWYSGNAEGGTNPVGQKNPNHFGLYDMSGNVWEMCSDWFGIDYYKNSPQKNPQGPPSGTARVLRGGSWAHDPQFCRTAFRHHRNPDARNVYNGFRLVLVQ